ncbi:hypothetical protein M231_06757 [Tremella mesenterica]|uniref:Protein kinase domain-containing protein n=1 Tax=Tremella mesenterica TaxID=5217 RepID=A0A4Q1BB18_TREME|nr:hypothetical protein M231_06757 [Tremella mesenterica]
MITTTTNKDVIAQLVKAPRIEFTFATPALRTRFGMRQATFDRLSSPCQPVPQSSLPASSSHGSSISTSSFGTDTSSASSSGFLTSLSATTSMSSIGTGENGQDPQSSHTHTLYIELLKCLHQGKTYNLSIACFQGVKLFVKVAPMYGEEGDRARNEWSIYDAALGDLEGQLHGVPRLFGVFGGHKIGDNKYLALLFLMEFRGHPFDSRSLTHYSSLSPILPEHVKDDVIRLTNLIHDRRILYGQDGNGFSYVSSPEDGSSALVDFTESQLVSEDDMDGEWSILMENRQTKIYLGRLKP